MAYGAYLKCAENHLKGFVGIGRRSAVAVDNHKNTKYGLYDKNSHLLFSCFRKCYYLCRCIPSQEAPKG